MATNSDHGDDRTNITNLLPSVYQSDVNKSLIEATFNKFLTKEDTTHVAGYIGQGNPQALLNKQLLEPTPHRQAHQLAPVMFSTVGTEHSVLTFKGFQQQLALVGVDVENLDQWASTERFNWVPPVNLDMLVNYADYFWKPDNSQTPAQYFSIENRCNKATSKLEAYKTIIARRGATMDVIRIDFSQNAFVVGNKQDDLFVAGFMFNTKETTNINLIDKAWTTLSSTYNGTTNETTIIVDAPLAFVSLVEDVNTPPPPPTPLYIGQWWYKYSTNELTPLSQLFTWIGTSWAITAQAFPCVVSLVDQQAVYQAEVNCACESDMGGWDAKQWDDGQQGSVVWNEGLLTDITFATEVEWIDHNTQTSPQDLWYDTTADQLKQRNIQNTAWTVIHEEFSAIIADTTGTTRWDSSVGCTLQEHNQWTLQNEWVHKSELTTFVGAKRAQVPILEYSSQTELNEWTEVTYKWKYRSEQVFPFESVSNAPNRLELEPIKSYIANNVAGIWYLYLASERSSMNTDVDYTSVFTPGYKFKIMDRYGASELLTVTRSSFREVGASDPTDLLVGRFVTIVELQESDFLSPVVAGVFYESTPGEPIPPYTRIEPIRTSTNEPWQGYHVHWMLDVANTTKKAAAPQMVNPYIKRDNLSAAYNVSTPEGMIGLTDTYQEFIPAIANLTQINLDHKFLYDPTHPGYYAVGGENQLRVYINGIRQYGTYREITQTAPAVPDYTVVNGVNLQHNVATTTFKCVYAIQFDRALAIHDVVRIEVAPPSYCDMGLYGVPVRTIEDDTDFALAVSTGSQPVYKSIIKYQRNEQVKTLINQYPLFNVYSMVSDTVVTTSPLFAFVEDVSYPMDPSTQRRIVSTTDGREYMFEQFLVDTDNGKMYAYRNVTGDEPEYWYNPLLMQLQKWDGKTWADVIVSPAPTGLVAYKPLVSIEEPLDLLDQHMSIWVNPLSQKIHQRDAINSAWNMLNSVVISDADPTLETIWKTSSTTPDYVPQYVDKDSVTIEKGSTEGDWEVISQWRNNPSHENHKTILYSQLITHLTSIVTQQDNIPGLVNRGIFTLTQKDYDYGIGGTIKEHNDAFDTLISAINVKEMTPVGVMEFAEEQYSSSLVIVRDIFTANIVDMLIALSGHDVATITDQVSELCISNYATNDFVARVYGDTTAYNSSTHVGMPQWIATLPMFGLTPVRSPHAVKDGSTLIIQHHDGHRSTVIFTAAEQDRLSRTLVKTLNATSPGSAVISETEPSSSLLPVYWYQIGGGKHDLYKLKSSVPTAVWELVDYVDMLGVLYLNIEQRLYDVTPLFPTPTFDFSTLTSTEQGKLVYNERMYDRFMNYVVTKQIKAPLINTTYSAIDPYTWNYSQCQLDTPPRDLTNTVQRSFWQSLYQQWYNTPYPHLEPWALQGYTEKPAWWDAEYLDTTLTRRWQYNHTTKTGMWENIRTGVVPVGQLYPGGVTRSTGNPLADNVSLPTYNYFSVNISDETIPGGFLPDDILPPYYDNTTVAPIHPTVRSLYRVFSTQIIAPSADYTFGDAGPTEWEWLTSSEYVYDQSIVAFLMQPAKFLRQTFGLNYITVGQLQVDQILEKVYSHSDVMFHGDIYDTDKTYIANGLNQWYVNFNRFNGYDTNVGFRSMWSTWTPRQAYQTAGIIDTSTLQLFNKNFDITDKDFEVTLANSGVLKELWVDAFEVSLLSAPPAVIRYNNQSRWKFSIDALAPVARSIEYYGTQQWPFVVNKDTDTFTAFKFNITNVTAAINTFDIKGNYTSFFLYNVPLVVSGSTTNDGTYTIIKATYDNAAGITKIKVMETVPTSIADGVIDIPSYSHNWQTGDLVHMTSSSTLPYPIEEGEVYYAIRVDSRNIKLASSMNNAKVNDAIDITSVPLGELDIGKVKATFQALEGSGLSKDIWFHYEFNTADVRTLHPPEVVAGLQTLINIIDGYKALQEANGVRYNNTVNFIEYDSDTGRPVSWQLETERFIEWAYHQRNSKLQFNDRFECVVSNVDENTLRFTAGAPVWASGTAVVISSTGTLPSPLYQSTPYYFISTTDPQLFKLSVTSRITDASVVDITSLGSGIITVSLSVRNVSYPSFEINPTRNNVWISTPQGILSNILTGPYSDVRVSQTIYDQYGRSLTVDKLGLYREDLLSRISVIPNIPNDVQLYPQGYVDPYTFIHMGGGHFFIEGYEHIIMFNNYTVGNDLMYDPFLGLYTHRFDIDYYEKTEYTLRPTLGGYYLLDGSFVRNFEGSIQNIRKYYDVMDLVEGTPESQHARHTLGYHPQDGSMSYLDLLNVNSKSQFMFYRGMIQTKGSIGSVKAFINSRKFVDAKVDEFWMYKIAEFGDSRPKIHPKIKLFANDSTRADIRLKFTAPNDIDSTVIYDLERGFETVSISTGDRWVDFPQQKTEIESALFLDAALSSMVRLYVTRSPRDGLPYEVDAEGGMWTVTPPFYPTAGQTTIDYWVHINTQDNLTTFRVWDGSEWNDTTTPLSINNIGYTTYLKLDQINDGVRVLRRQLTRPGDLTSYHTSLMNEVDLVNGYSRVNSEVIKFASAEYQFTNTSVRPYSNPPVVEFELESTDAGFVAIGDKIDVTFESPYSDYTGTYDVVNSYYSVDEGFTRVQVSVPLGESLPQGASGIIKHYGFFDLLTIFTVNVSDDKINPARLYDTKSHVKIHDVPLWHPAIGLHSPQARHNVDLFNSSDPAQYTSTLQTTAVSANPWMSAETNTTWLDTSYLGYMPYYDNVIVPDVDARIFKWGNRTPWSQIKLYQWVESLLSPSDWAVASTLQSGDLSIPDKDKVTGTPRVTTFKRTRYRDEISVVSEIDGLVQLLTVNNTYENGAPVMFSVMDDASTLPSTLESGTQYFVAEHDADTQQFVIVDVDNNVIDLTDAPSMYVVQPFVDNWRRVPLHRERLYAPFQQDYTTTSLYREPVLTLSSDAWEIDDVVDVYVNGVLTAQSYIVTYTFTIDMVGTEYKMIASDIIDVVRPVPTLTDEQKAFDPDEQDDGITLVQWTESTEYATTTRTYDNIVYTYYYYWVEGVTVQRHPTDRQCLSLKNAVDQLNEIPTPYMIVQDPQDDLWIRGFDVPPWDKTSYDGALYVSYNTSQQYMPSIFYRKAVLANVAGYVTEDDRYMVEFIRDLTLRDTLHVDRNNMNVKNKHEKWMMFRREQIDAVPRKLWIKMTEALMQCKYDDYSITVPSFEREYYDQLNGTDTKYGLEEGQIFVNPQFARATVIDYLQDPLHDFKPADINQFFITFPATEDSFWADPEQVKNMCDFIYTTFDTVHTNGIWFEVLSDALVTKSKYKDLHKTSWLALHGIRILDINGMFDEY